MATPKKKSKPKIASVGRSLDEPAGDAATKSPTREPAKPPAAENHKMKRPRDRALVQVLDEIEQTDQLLLDLLNRRAELAQQWSEGARGTTDAVETGVSSAAALTAASTAVQKAVERAVAKNQGPLPPEVVRSVFRELVSGCQTLTRPVQGAFLGPLYSYSHLATIEHFGQSAEMAPLATIEAVFREVVERRADFGLVPLENSTDGRIADTLGMFCKVRVSISAEVKLRIHHNLLGSGRRDQIRTICSKPQALSQCRGWLAQNFPQAEIKETTSTTAAAEMAAADASIGAVASRQAAANYGLHVLTPSIEDNKNNVTRFAVIGHASAARTANDKTSLLFQLPHQPGALADVMAIFRRNRLNLTWIESFPLVDSPAEYVFFIELQGHASDLRVRRAVTALEKKTDRIEVLGSYASAAIID